MPVKPIEFLGDSRRSLREFPDDAKRDAGYQLDRVAARRFEAHALDR